MNPTLDPKALADRIDAVLPQTQCRRCGFDGCRPYAEAIAGGEAIDRCPPGGDAVIAALAALTARPAVPLDASRGAHGLLAVACIDEALCIGCTLCIDACPMDAIAGAAKRMHTVLPALCSGCELCIAPCPVDCIAMIAAGRAWSPADALAAKERFEAHTRRLRSRHHEKRPAGRSAVAAPTSLASSDGDAQKRRADVAAARARAEARRRQAAKTTT